MKKVKDLQKWIEGYNHVRTLSDELELAFDFYKDDLVTEAEVDEGYAKALEAVENLELKNMLRGEADQMSCVLKINSGAGGTETKAWHNGLPLAAALFTVNEAVCRVYVLVPGQFHTGGCLVDQRPDFCGNLNHTVSSSFTL